MSVAKMRFVNIVGELSDFDTVMRSCCIGGNFHAEQAPTVLEDYEEFIPVDEPNPYTGHLRMAIDLGTKNHVKFGFRNFDKLAPGDEPLFSFLEKTRDVSNELSEKARNLTQTVAHLETGIQELNYIREYNIPLDELFSCRFVRARIGRLPKESYAKLAAYYQDELLLFFPLGEERSYYWGVNLALDGEEEKNDEIFHSLYFERIEFIEKVRGTPRQAIAELQITLEGKRKELADAQEAYQDFWNRRLDEFLRVYSRIKYLHDSFEMRRYSVKCGQSFYIFGWVPETEAAGFAAQFRQFPYVDCVIEDERQTENFEPPTTLVNPRAVRPFESFVQMYGLPVYNEIDPTVFLSVTYSIIFGIMFGDVGQGFVLLLGGLLLWFLKKSQLGGILIRCSVFSMIFGVLYNSVFGFEDLLPFTVLPVHRSSSTNWILLGAIAIGFVLILCCMGLNIANGVRQHSIEKIAFSSNGIAGMVLYVAAVVSVLFFMMFKKNILSLPFVLALIAVPLLLIFFRRPLSRLLERRKDWKPESPGEFFIESFFELFEILLSFLSNTISFIRIGAFVLSHSGMMLAVFTISELFGKGQNPVALVIGNAFVIVLEGLMSGIQGMRLQFYEMFSRFYSGSGRAYTPVKIHYEI